MAHWVIFGATKGIGLALANIGIQQGHQVTTLVRQQTDAERLTAEGIQTFIGDATDPSSLEAIFAYMTPDTVIFTTIGGGQAILLVITILSAKQSSIRYIVYYLSLQLVVATVGQPYHQEQKPFLGNLYAKNQWQSPIYRLAK